MVGRDRWDLSGILATAGFLVASLVIGSVIMGNWHRNGLALPEA